MASSIQRIQAPRRFGLGPLVLATATLASGGCFAAAPAVDTSQWVCAKCPYPKAATGHVEAGVGYVPDNPARFGDYTGLADKGAHFVLGGQLFQRSEGGFYVDALAADLGLDTRTVQLQAGQEGLYALRFGYRSIPREWGDNPQTPYRGAGGNTLTLPAGYPAASTGAMPLAATLQPVDLSLKWQRAELAATLYTGTSWRWQLKLRRDQRDGTRPGSASFFNSVAQLPLPVEHVNNQVEVAAAFVGRRLQASLSYSLSQFYQGNESFIWANAYNPVVAGATRGQLVLAPDNQFHQISAIAAYQLTPALRASADLAFGRLTQNEAFVAPTLNTTLWNSLQAMPASSLDGRVDTFSGGIKLSATPVRELRLVAQAAFDRRDNRTAVRTYPQVATDLFVTPALANTPFDIWRDRYSASADFRVTPAVKLSGGVQLDEHQRNYSEVIRTSELSGWAGAGAQVLEGLNLSVKLARANRTRSTYGTAVWNDAPENPLLRKLNFAARQRDRSGVRADATLNDRVSASLSVDVLRDRYDDTPVGLQAARGWSVAADVALAVSDDTQITVWAQGEHTRSQQAGSSSFSGPDYRARVRERFEVAGATVKHAWIPERLEVGGDIVVARSGSQVLMDTGTSDSEFPASKTRLDSVKLFASYRVSERLTLLGTAGYQASSAQDWRVDGLLPDTVFNLLALGDPQPRRYASVWRLAARWSF